MIILKYVNVISRYDPKLTRFIQCFYRMKGTLLKDLQNPRVAIKETWDNKMYLSIESSGWTHSYSSRIFAYCKLPNFVRKFGLEQDEVHLSGYNSDKLILMLYNPNNE